jgi:adenylate cyclase
MGVWVRFLPSGESVEVCSGTTLLEAVKEAGLPIAEACGAGGLCGRCGVRVAESARALSEETEAERIAKSRNRIDPSLRLACLVTVAEDVEVTADYW